MNFSPLHRTLVALFLGTFVTSTGFATLVAWDSSSAIPNATAGSAGTQVGSVPANDSASSPLAQTNPNNSIPDYLQVNQTAQSSKVDASAAILPSPQAAQTSGSAFNEKFVSVPDFGAYQYLALADENDSAPAAFSDGTTPVPEMSALLPIIGLVVAVASTQILRRRRAARNLLQA